LLVEPDQLPFAIVWLVLDFRNAAEIDSKLPAITSRKSQSQKKDQSRCAASFPWDVIV
jgi:hypothetical protein